MRIKKFITCFLILSILSLCGNIYAGEKRGVDLLIQKKDSQQIRGELIAVKNDSLLLKDTESGADVSVIMNHVKAITIVKESKTLVGIGVGFLVGAGVGMLIGLIGWELFNWAPSDTKTKYRIVGAAGGAGGMIGALVGGTTGANQSETIQIEGKSANEINDILEELRKKARISDFK